MWTPGSGIFRPVGTIPVLIFGIEHLALPATCLAFLHLFQGRDARDAFVLDGEGGDGIGEVDGGAGIGVAREVDEEGGSEDVARAGGVEFAGAVGGEMFGSALLEECGTMTAIGSDEQRDEMAPTGQDGVSFGAVAVGEGQQVVMAEDERVESGQHLLCILPGSGPDAAISVPASQPALRCGGDKCAWVAGK